MTRWIPALAIAMAVSSPIAEGADVTYSNAVHCSTADGRCDGGLAISGADVSVINVEVPNATTTTIAFDAGERPSCLVGPCTTHGSAVRIVVQKNRHPLPMWLTRKPGRPKPPTLSATCDDLRYVTDGTEPEIGFSVGGTHFAVPVRNQKWWLESGGVYVYSWARDQQIVTRPSAVQGKVDVIEKRAGDRLGPMTGVTFVFHPGDFPEFGWEFATATNAGRTNYFLGGTVRLIQFNDRALLTLGGGIAHASVIDYPNVSVNTPYDATDPFLTGRTHYVDRPYISLGLGINIGGPQSSKSASP